MIGKVLKSQRIFIYEYLIQYSTFYFITEPNWDLFYIGFNRFNLYYIISIQIENDKAFQYNISGYWDRVCQLSLGNISKKVKTIDKNNKMMFWMSNQLSNLKKKTCVVHLVFLNTPNSFILRNS